MATQKKSEKNGEYRRRKRYLSKRKVQRIEIENNKKRKRMIKKIVMFIFDVVTLILFTIFMFSGKWLTMEPKSIIISYLLYVMIEFAVIHLFMLAPDYRMRGGGEAPKRLIHSLLIIFLSLGVGVMSRFFINIFCIELLIIIINVSLLETAFYIFENKEIYKIRRNYKTVMIDIFVDILPKMCIEIVMIYLLTNDILQKSNMKL